MVAVNIVAGAELGDLHRLEPLARQLFGQGDRPAGWFSRKLHRECVNPSLTQVAVRNDRDPTDPTSWVGYVLVGTPPSRAPAVRTAGTGVLHRFRGQGVGGRLLAAAAKAATAANHPRIELAAEPALEGFYRRHGFQRCRRTPCLATLVAFATGAELLTALPARAGLEDPPPDRRVFSQWLPEAWERLPASERATAQIGLVHLRLATEGRARVVHRIVAPSNHGDHRIADTLLELQSAMAAPRPIVVVGVPTVSRITEILEAHGWAVAQRWLALERCVT